MARIATTPYGAEATSVWCAAHLWFSLILSHLLGDLWQYTSNSPLNPCSRPCPHQFSSPSPGFHRLIIPNLPNQARVRWPCWEDITTFSVEWAMCQNLSCDENFQLMTPHTRTAQTQSTATRMLPSHPGLHGTRAVTTFLPSHISPQTCINSDLCWHLSRPT